MIMTNGWHAGRGQRARLLARLGLFLAAMQVPYRQSPFGPDKHNTTTSVVLASGYEKPVNALDSPDEVATMFSPANPHVEQYPTAVVRDERDGTVDIEIGNSVVSLEPATTGCFHEQVGVDQKDPDFREAVPTTEVAEISRQSYDVAVTRPEALDSRLVFMDRGAIPDEKFGRLVDGYLILAVDLMRSMQVAGQSIQALYAR
jgi:hypothetical protein